MYVRVCIYIFFLIKITQLTESLLTYKIVTKLKTGMQRLKSKRLRLPLIKHWKSEFWKQTSSAKTTDTLASCSKLPVGECYALAHSLTELSEILYFIIMFALRFKSFETISFTVFNFYLLQIIKHLWTKDKYIIWELFFQFIYFYNQKQW